MFPLPSNADSSHQRPTTEIESQLQQQQMLEMFDRRVKQIEQRYERARQQFMRSFVKEFSRSEKERDLRKRRVRKQWLLALLQVSMIAVGFTFAFYHPDQALPPT